MRWPIFTLVVILALTARVSADQQQTAGSVSGTIRDASGGVLPGVGVTLADTATGVRYWNTTDGAGRFAFADLSPSRYELIAELPGFATILNQLTLEPGESLQRSLSMRIGALEERVRVGCAAIGAEFAARPGPILTSNARASATRLFPVPLAEAQQAPVRVGGNIKAPGKVRDVKPICPRGVLPPLFVGTVVKLEATIGTDGFIKDVRSLDPKTSEGSQARFVESATQAVRQWQFTPTRLNNVPVPIIVSITVEYHRM